MFISFLSILQLISPYLIFFYFPLAKIILLFHTANKYTVIITIKRFLSFSWSRKMLNADAR